MKLNDRDELRIVVGHMDDTSHAMALHVTRREYLEALGCARRIADLAETVAARVTVLQMRQDAEASDQ